MGDSTIEQITEDRAAHYEPFGWHHWPEHPWMSYQFRRAWGRRRRAAARSVSASERPAAWFPETRRAGTRSGPAVAERNRVRGDEAEAAGNIQTAKACWLRAVDYYRQAEFWLLPDDPRRLETFTKCEDCFNKAGRYFVPPVEPVAGPV